jgi:hypothetical protein
LQVPLQHCDAIAQDAAVGKQLLAQVLFTQELLQHSAEVVQATPAGVQAVARQVWLLNSQKKPLQQSLLSMQAAPVKLLQLPEALQSPWRHWPLQHCASAAQPVSLD